MDCYENGETFADLISSLEFAADYILDKDCYENGENWISSQQY